MKEIKDLWLKSKKDLREMNLTELKEELKNSSRKMFELKMKLQLNELKQTHLLRFLRRYIAVLNTIIWEKMDKKV